MKEKNIWHNQAPFMNKSVRKFIIVQIRLLNNFIKEDSFINEIVYKRWRNFCAMLIKNTKRNFINNRNVNKITDNKSFWKSVKPSFTEKALKDEKNSTCWKRYNYFGRKRSCGDLSVLKCCENSKEHSDRILNAIKTFEKHLSILKIKELSCGCWFSFENVSLDDVKIGLL